MRPAGSGYARLIGRLSRGLACALLWLLADIAQAGLRLVLDERQLTAAQQQASQALLDEAFSRLPPTFVERLDRQVVIRWRDLPPEVYGRASAGRWVELNRGLLPALTDGSLEGIGTGRTHGNQYRELLATLLHELTHLYDRARLLPPERHAGSPLCRQRQQIPKLAGQQENCRDGAARRFTLSDDPRLLDLAGWLQRTDGRSGTRPDNGQTLRSPDAYELTNAFEFVAVNMEYFLLDPQYACRRPLLAAYLREHFDWMPARQSACESGYAYLNAGRDFARQPLAWLDPERVYQIDYLLAEANQQLASRWGHGMLRLVICAPGRPRGEACRLDLDQHLVLSYRAFVGDLQLSNWAGLTGRYPSRLFILPLEQVIEEYTKVELRGLVSVPLKLNREQIEGVVIRAAEQHWSYDGEYFFLSNNCAVETLKLLRSGSDDPRLWTLYSMLPNGLLDLLDDRGLAERQVLDDRELALRRGYRFDSFRERYQQMFDILRQRLPIAQTQVEDWLQMPAAQRQPWIEQADLRSSAALLLLEQAALRRQLLLIQDELKQRYLRQARTDTKVGRAGRTLQDILRESGFLSRPAELFDAGYGLPLAADWQRLEQHSQARQQRLRRLNDELDQQVRQLVPPARLAELQASESNLRAIAGRLRRLHQDSGGLRLPETGG